MDLILMDLVIPGMGKEAVRKFFIRPEAKVIVSVRLFQRSSKAMPISGPWLFSGHPQALSAQGIADCSMKRWRSQK